MSVTRTTLPDGTLRLEAAPMPVATLESLEADAQYAIDGWTRAACELSLLRKENARLETENRLLRLAVTTAVNMLARRAPFREPRERTAYLRLRDLVEGGTRDC